MSSKMLPHIRLSNRAISVEQLAAVDNKRANQVMDYMKGIDIPKVVDNFLNLSLTEIKITLPIGVLISASAAFFTILRDPQASERRFISPSISFKQHRIMMSIVSNGVNKGLYLSHSNFTLFPVRLLLQRSTNETFLNLELYVPIKISEDTPADINNCHIRRVATGFFIKTSISSQKEKIILHLSETLTKTAQQVAVNYTTEDAFLNFLSI